MASKVTPTWRLPLRTIWIICGVLLMGLTQFFAGGCDSTAQTSESVTADKAPAATGPAAAEKPAKPGETRTAVLAGGCFWCIEGVFDQLEGVTKVVSGYAGGSKETASYEAVCTGSTGHAEAVKITYDPSKISFARLLEVFFTAHDPTTKNRQGPDVGTQYRSAIFYENDEQKQTAEAYIKELEAAKVFRRPIVTTLEPLKPDGFYPAEAYHQNFVACHLSHPYIVQEALPKIRKIREKFAAEVRPATTQP